MLCSASALMSFLQTTDDNDNVSIQSRIDGLLAVAAARRAFYEIRLADYV